MVNWVTTNCTGLRWANLLLCAVLCDSACFSLGYAERRNSGFLITYNDDRSQWSTDLIVKFIKVLDK